MQDGSKYRNPNTSPWAGVVALAVILAFILAMTALIV